MEQPPESPPERPRLHLQEEVSRRVGAREMRKQRRRAEGKHDIWFGLGVFGIIGWSVALPALIALAIGIWIDHTWPGRFSWSLMLLVVGVSLGCLNAWRWVQRERQMVQDRGEKKDAEHE